MSSRDTLTSLIALCLLPLASDATTLSGFVRDSEDGETIPFCTVAIRQLSVGTATNSSGYYAVTGLPPGTHIVSFIHIGYTDRKDTIVVADTTSADIRLDVRMRSEAVDIGQGVLITTERERDEQALQSSFLSLQPTDISEMPALVESDLLRSLQLLPGIQAASDISSGLYVRGGGPDQTLILLDGIPVYNPSHAFGFFSTFSPEAIKDVNLYKGAYPAPYGGNLGAVLEVSNREGNRERFAGKGAVSLISAQLALEGPVGTGSWMVSGRRTYLDPLLAAIRSAGKDVPGYYFYDFNGKINQSLGASDALLISAYLGQDDLNFDLEDDTFFNIRWGNTTLTSQWTHIFSPAVFGRFTAAYSKYDSKTAATIFDTPVSFNNSIGDLTFKGDVDYFASSAHNLSGGLALTRYDFNFDQSFNSQDQIDLQETPRLLTSYLQDDWQLDVLTQVRLGVRATYFSEGSRWNVMPRYSVSRTVAPNVRLKLGGGAYRQYLQQVTTEGFSGGDFWVPLDETVKPGRALQTVFGAEWEPSRRYQMTVEVYYNDLDDLVLLDNNTAADNQDTSSDDVFKSGGSGHATGMEWFVQRRTGPLTGWIGYTLGRTRRTFPELNEGRSFAPKYDRRHDFKTALTYRRGPWRYGANFVYATGQAFTPASARYTLRSPATGSIEDYVLPASRNSARLLPYHRMDVSLRRSFSLWGSEKEWYLQISNLYSRRNEWFVQYDTDDPNTEPKVVKQLPILPTFGMKFEF
jgi:hypothetical protein